MFWVLFTFSLLGFAESPAPRVSVWTRGDPAVAKAYLPKNHKVLDAEREAAELNADGYLLPGARDALFRKLGIEVRLQSLDEVDKDMLVMGAPYYSVAELKAQYPMLNEHQLHELKRELGRRK